MQLKPISYDSPLIAWFDAGKFMVPLYYKKNVENEQCAVKSLHPNTKKWDSLTWINQQRLNRLIIQYVWLIILIRERMSDGEARWQIWAFLNEQQQINQYSLCWLAVALIALKWLMEDVQKHGSRWKRGGGSPRNDGGRMQLRPRNRWEDKHVIPADVETVKA